MPRGTFNSFEGLIRAVALQAKSFPEIIFMILKHGLINHTHLMAKLQPQIASDGLIWQTSRIQFVKNIKRDLKHPILLPPSTLQ